MDSKKEKTEWQTSCKSIQEANLHLLESGKFSDVIFVVGSEKTEVPAHKLILMARSSVFETMFDERWEVGANPKVEIPEVDSNSFIKFLDFLYTNEVVSICGKVTVEVLYLANKYNVADLVLECNDLLIQSMVVTNAIYLNQVASRLDQESLLKQTKEFILRNAEAVFLDCGFLEIEKYTLQEYLKNDNLRINELTLFGAIVRWANNKCKHLKLEETAQNQRAVLEGLIPLIRFPVLTQKDFTEKVILEHPGILTDSETISLYMHFSTELSTAPTLAFSTIRRAEPIAFCVNLFKSNEIATNKRQLQTLCLNQGGYNYSGACESAITICPDRDICIKGVELDQSERCNGSSGNKPLISSLTKEYKRHGRSYGSVEMESIKASISISILDQAGVSNPMETKHVEDTHTTKIEFENEIYVEKDEVCNLKLIVTGSSMANGNGSIQKTGKNEHIYMPSVKVNCENDFVTFTIGPTTSNCVLRNQRQQNLYNSNCVCISAGHIKAVHFNFPPAIN